MSLLEWITFQAASENAILSEVLIKNHQNLNSFIFVLYTILCMFIKRPAYLLAFFISAMLFEAKVFDPLLEHQLYLITFALYTYVFTNCKTLKSKFGCGILLVLSFALAADAALFGEYGYYGASETFLYRNIEHLSLYAHSLFICSFIDIKRIYNSLRNFVDAVVRISRTSAYM